MKQFVNVLLLHTATECFMIDWRKKFHSFYIKMQKKEKCKLERMLQKKIILTHEKFDVVM